MRRPPKVLLASVAAMLLFGCEGTQPLEPFATGRDVAAARVTGGPNVAAPSNALATAYSATQIDVTWRDNSTNEKTFEIYRSYTGAAGTYTWLASTAANTTTYRNQGLEPGVQYCYAVLAADVNGKNTVNSVFSNTTCATTPLPPAAAPSNAAAVALSANQIEIKWQDNSTNETHFEVHRSAYPQLDLFTLLTRTAGNAISYSDEGLFSSFDYCYKIRAVQVIGVQVIVSSFSNVTCAWPLPEAASSVTATPTDSYTFAVGWTGIGVYFRIDRSNDGGVAWNAAGTAAENTRSFWDNVVPEQAVCYRVVTYNPSGEAPPSNMHCTAAPAAPTEVAWGSTLDGLTVELTWRDNSSVEDGYEVRELYPDCFRDWDNVEYCYGYAEFVIAVLPANTTSFRGRGNKVSVYAMKAGGYSSAGVSP